MKPRYIPTPGTALVVALIDSMIATMPCLGVRLAAGVTLEFSLENPDDWISTNGFDPSPAVAQGIAPTLAAPVWIAAPAAVNGVVSFTFPVRALRFTPTTGGVCTILQQGGI